MSYSESEISALERAIATGTLRVTVNGKTIEYRSLDDMLRVRDLMRREAGIGGGSSSNRRFATYRRGT